MWIYKSVEKQIKFSINSVRDCITSNDNCSKHINLINFGIAQMKENFYFNMNKTVNQTAEILNQEINKIKSEKENKATK